MKKLFVIAATALLSLSCTQQKTGYVDTEELLTEYNELKETKDMFSAKGDAINAELEPKIQAYQIKEDLFRKNGPSMARKEAEKQYAALNAEAQQLQQERQMKIGQLQTESQGAIDSLIKKVKDKVKSYGQAKGYDFIYGSNDAGSVLYGKDELNLTEEILAELNSEYDSEIED
ncbi:OmpH family outer membrane protein [Dokdonia sp. Hel_I_53]|uniref:OmpH family outer membrane protein n=1 Tax=Dokdonia sp. Hel_I_53 TaxID=1566287 RepID=UPI00119C7DC2|nr:OmpH family outer membrane protein [Dokdonia sp. Hel_I_53]TVZ52651.1 periplasmic chaperone for outer membrane proteins Skp [Dokdonia sp. Hel_I_53]